METQHTRSSGTSPEATDALTALQLARAGDREAFRQLVRQHQARVFDIAWQLTGQRADAEELAQEVFVALHAALARLATPAHLTRWLLRTVSRRAMEWFRQHSRLGERPDAHALESAHDPLAAVHPQRLLPQLRPDARAVMLLRYQQDLDPADIAAVLEIPVATVKSHLLRSLEWMSGQALEDTADLERRLRERLAAPDPGADFTASVMDRVQHRSSHRRRRMFSSSGIGGRVRRRGRFILIGALAAVGIAGIVLALWLAGVLPWPVAAEVSAPQRVAADATAARQPRVSGAASPVEHGNPAAALAVSGTSQAPAPLRDASPRYTVIVMPLRQEYGDPAARLPVETFYAALLDELRKVPALTLLIPGVTAPPADADRPPDYLLTVASLEATALSPGGTTLRFADDRGEGLVTLPTTLPTAGVVTLLGGGGDATRSASSRSGPQWPVEIKVQSVGQPQSGSFTSAFQIGGESAPGSQFCAASQDAAAACLTVAQIAAKQVEMLRTRVFPDVFMKRQLMARIRDDSLPGMERYKALSDLLGTQLRGRGPVLESAGIETILDYAAVLRADQRAQLWRSLRGISHPDLVAPLIDSLRRDPDETVRFEALATLVANYGAEPRVRAAIESVAREDSQQIVRMAARRVLNGDAEWRGYVVTTLKDTSLPYAERLAPLLFVARSASTPAEALGMKTLLNDEQVVDPLVGLVRDGWFDPAQAGATRNALDLLANAGNPAAPDVLVEMPQENSQPGVAPATAPVPAAGPGPQISPAAMSWLLKHRNNPRVRKMLEDIANGNADPRLGSIIEQMQQRESQRP